VASTKPLAAWNSCWCQLLDRIEYPHKILLWHTISFQQWIFCMLVQSNYKINNSLHTQSYVVLSVLQILVIEWRHCSWLKCKAKQKYWAAECYETVVMVFYWKFVFSCHSLKRISQLCRLYITLPVAWQHVSSLILQRCFLSGKLHVKILKAHRRRQIVSSQALTIVSHLVKFKNVS
jgi:hypothetical protein